MNVLVSGASGLIGSALVAALGAEGHRVLRLVRPESSHAENPPGGSAAESAPQRIAWDPAAGWIDSGALEQSGAIDAAVHLAGAGIADKRWSPARKQLILDSRIQGTRLLCETLAARPQPPATFVCASAIGFYGNRGDERLDESSTSGQSAEATATFTSEVVAAWESSTSALDPTVTVAAHARLGVVLAASGGALAAQLPFFRLGLGGRIGSGQQWISWITLEDAVRAFSWLLAHPLAGPVNLTSPAPVTNAEFTKALGRALHRPTAIPIPRAALWLRLGRELTADLLEAGAHVSPARLTEAGFGFEHPTIDEALSAVLS